MNPRHALRPDLTQCLLEDRALLALPIGLMPSQLLATASNNSLIVPGFGSPGSGSGGGTAPGPSFFYLLIGSTGGSGLVGSRLGGGVSVFGMSSTIGSAINVGITVGSGASAGGGGGGGVGGLSNFSGFGGSISSGYNFALNSSNNFGMSGTAVGSIVAHNYDRGPVSRAPMDQDSSDEGPIPEEIVEEEPISTSTSVKSTLTTRVELGDNLLRNDLTGSTLLSGGSKKSSTTTKPKTTNGMTPPQVFYPR
jgi:hypothetical protein